MKHIDSTEKWKELINSERATDILTENEKKRWEDISKDEKNRFITALIEKPILFENPEIIYDWYFRSKWVNALECTHKKESVFVFEIGAGGCDIVPKAISKKYCHPDTTYVTATLNNEPTQLFTWNTEHEPISISVIEDDASNIKDYVGENAFDVVVFEHSINDVLETILAEKNGIDTVNNGWMDILPAITEVVNREWNGGTFEKNTKPEFLKLIKDCFDVLKPGGWIIATHYQFQYNLDIGISPKLNSELIPMVRKWISEAGLGKEFFFADFDSNWWLFVKKII